jgi:DinB family protein
MKRGFFMVVVWCAAGSAFAQAPAGQQISLATSLQRGYATVKQNLTEEIAKMPEENFSFKPGPAPELRNFGMLFGHVANAQFGSCSAALGQPNPNQGHNLETEATTKAALTKALADSFALCDKAFAALTDQNATEMVKQGQNEIARSALLAGVVIHSNEMYGTASVYLRAKGMVPPSTERQTQMMRGGGAGRGNPGR